MRSAGSGPTTEASWSRSHGSGLSCAITRSAHGGDLSCEPSRGWLPKRCPSARTRSSHGGWLPTRCPAGTRSGHEGRQRPVSVRAVTKAGHGTSGGWHSGCRCARCRQAHSDTQRTWKRARAQERLPTDVRQQLVDAIYDRKPFRQVLGDLGLTPNQVWGLTKTDEEWSRALDAALTETRRSDQRHGTNAAYVAGCVCKECRGHQRIRMARSH